MGFFAPWFLARRWRPSGLPVWLHLLRKHKSTPLPFSSLMFFEQRTQSSIKHRRLRYLLLFSLRTLLVSADRAGFRASVCQQKFAAAPAQRRVTVLAIDNSLSMRAGNRSGRGQGGRQIAGLGACVRASAPQVLDIRLARAGP